MTWYISGLRSPDWWPEPIPEGHCLQLLKSIAVNSEKTIFMQCQCTLVKYKVRMVVRGDQQVKGESFTYSDLYAAVLKAPEARLILAIAAAEGCSVIRAKLSCMAAWEMM